MLRCTYIILIHNNEGNIPRLVDSLKKIRGEFIKEFIIVDDGSTDKSLSVLKSSLRDFPRTTILTQEESGSTVSINKAISLATGDYVHFVEGMEIVHPDSSARMMEACKSLGAGVALGQVRDKQYFAEEEIPEPQLLQMPIIRVLLGDYIEARHIGRSGSLVSLDLLTKVDKADTNIYTHHMSLSLRCAKYSNFAFLASPVSLRQEFCSQEKDKFCTYNNLKSIHNFASENHTFLSELRSDLLKALSFEAPDKLARLKYSTYSLLSKYVNHPDIAQVLGFYNYELNKLF